jgi:hypothetical protein
MLVSSCHLFSTRQTFLFGYAQSSIIHINNLGATKQVLRANNEGDEPPHEQDDAPPQPQA